jgi:Ice-binding-like
MSLLPSHRYRPTQAASTSPRSVSPADRPSRGGPTSFDPQSANRVVVEVVVMTSLFGSSRSRSFRGCLGVSTAIVSVVVIGATWTPSASAATKVQLGTATSFAVLAGTAVTDIPTSVITGNVGLSPTAGSGYAGLTPAEVTGTIYAVDASGPGGTAGNNPGLLTTAKNDLTTAFTTAAGQSPITTFSGADNQLGGQTLVPGVYAFGHASTANITAASPLTLNGQGDANAVFVFQASSDLVTASSSVVQLENGAQACNVFWEVGSSATLSSSSTFVGTLMALTSATLNTGATVQGRILARNGDVTLDHNTITAPTTCTVAATTATTSPTATTAPAGTGGAGAHAATGSGGTAGGAAGAGSSTGTGTGTGVIPTGFPHTGAGGAAHASDSTLVALGGLALAASGVAVALALRRRRIVTAVAARTSYE